MERKRIKVVIRFALAAGVIIAGAAAYAALPVVQAQLSGAANALRAADVKGIRIFIRTASSFPVMAGFLLGIFQSLVPTLPDGEFIRATSGVFGPIPGFLVSWISLTIGATAAFALMRGLVGTWLERAISRRSPGVSGFFNRNGSILVLATRLFPFIPGDIVSYFAGAMPIRLTGYLWATAVALFPRVLFFAIFVEEVAPEALLVYRLLATCVSTLLFLAVIRYTVNAKPERESGDKLTVGNKPAGNRA